MALKKSSRGQVAPFIVMDVMREANRLESIGRNILHLEVGQPSTGAPSGVIAAAQRALATDKLGYTEALGIDKLRKRITQHYRETYDIDLAKERVVVTTGSSGGFMLAFLAAFDSGDRVILADPGYPAYRNILAALGIESVGIPVTAEYRYQITPELLDGIDGDIDGLVVASPANPTGTMISANEMAALTMYCDDRGIRLISDEIYHGITYEMPGVTALAYTQNAVVINSFSKFYSMTGWRVGWMVIPEQLDRSIECLAQNIFISVPALSQHAASVAFDCKEELDQNVARYAANRELLLGELPKLGLTKLAPADGAFYIYADISHLTNNSEEFCRRMLNESGIAVAPGTDFDRYRGGSTIRISFAGDTPTIDEAAQRLNRWIDR
ncbi:MAG: putative N-acetyl-LL-diaminopimelate aminotransferase [Alphaproteobacteria bacterium MarineAlpha11_Bin1]|nr:MAG: putative N-acetyl-LL-diaminopimelate aminotransferase [Alphaproteobacteria bacterium MarineAlpha11_Bin1]